MDIRATIYLKSGGNTAMTIHDTSLSKQQEVYSNIFNGDRDKDICCHVGLDSIQIVPSDNIAMIDLKELVDKVQENIKS